MKPQFPIPEEVDRQLQEHPQRSVQFTAEGTGHTYYIFTSDPTQLLFDEEAIIREVNQGIEEIDRGEATPLDLPTFKAECREQARLRQQK